MAKAPKRPSLLKAIMTTFWKEYFMFSMLCFFNDVIIRLGQPLLLGKLLMYFREDSTLSYEDAVTYASGIVVLNGINAILVNQFFIKGFHNGMKVRVAVCSLIYRKVYTKQSYNNE